MDLNIINSDLVTVGDIEFIQELDTYKFPNRVYQKYKHDIKDNIDISYQDARKSIIRDIILSNKAPIKEGLEYKRVFYYGNLSIHINIIERSICYIKNYKGMYEFNVDENKKKVLNEIMGIENKKIQEDDDLLNCFL